MRITDVRTHVLLDPGYDVAATSSAQDTILAEIKTDGDEFPARARRTIPTWSP